MDKEKEKQTDKKESGIRYVHRGDGFLTVCSIFSHITTQNRVNENSVRCAPLAPSATSPIRHVPVTRLAMTMTDEELELEEEVLAAGQLLPKLEPVS